MQFGSDKAGTEVWYFTFLLSLNSRYNNNSRGVLIFVYFGFIWLFQVRAKIQSAQLLSDMESFKAANPSCVLDDFVRWHSPRDWEEGAGLSTRMRLPSNMWTELWDQVSLPDVSQGIGFGSE
jgi:hypothetical protein